MSELTKAQYYTLLFLDMSPRPRDQSDPNLRRRVGMLRVMEERGLVSRNLHNRWYITAAGRAALSKENTDGR